MITPEGDDAMTISELTAMQNRSFDEIERIICEIKKYCKIIDGGVVQAAEACGRENPACDKNPVCQLSRSHLVHDIELQIDPWKSSVLLTHTPTWKSRIFFDDSAKQLQIVSYGPDQKPGGGDDIVRDVHCK